MRGHSHTLSVKSFRALTGLSFDGTECMAMAPEIRLCVIGPFKAYDAAGQELRLELRRARAILAVLALSPGRQRSRAALQTMFWNRNGSTDGAQNLRTALRRIRVALGPASECLIAEGPMVKLREDGIEVDLDAHDFTHLAGLPDSSRPVLLEDMDSLAEPEFQNWLRDQRAAFEARYADTEPAAPAKKPLVRRDNGFWLQVIAPEIRDGDPASFHANLLATAIAQGVSDCGVASVSTTKRDGPGLALSVTMLSTPGGSQASVSLSESHTDRVLWTGNQFIPTDNNRMCDETELMRFVNQMVDIAIYCFRSLGTQYQEDNAFTLTFDAVNRMSRLGLNDLLQADTQLDDAFDRQANGLVLAWKAYLRTFLVGEHNFDPQQISQEVRELCRRALEMAPVNAYVLALTSYVHTFILQEYHAGVELAERSIQIAPGNPFGHAFAGAAASYNGRHAQGLRHLRRARELSGPGPHKFTIDFLTGAASTLAGEYDTAIYMNELVRQTKPDYKPAQRFLTALYSKQGDRERALAVMEQLRKAEPDFSIRKMQEPSYPSAALRASGLLNQTDPDFL
jgi:DNA-binding SARP family transcriptional activator